MKQAPRWLPDRLRARWDDRRVQKAILGIRSTPPIVTAAHEAAAAELHMPVCRRDVDLALVAIKSLLRYADDRLSVSFSDDGSLTEKDRNLIRRHLPGSRVLERAPSAPSLRLALERYPELYKLYVTGFRFAPKLLHPTILTIAPKAILLDADTAFFRRPTALLEWIDSPSHEARYLRDHRDESRDVVPAVRDVFDEVGKNVSDAATPWNVPHFFFNAGLLAFRPERLNLNVAERYLSWRQTRLDKLTRLPYATWFGDWTIEQTSYMLMFASAQTTPTPLGREYGIGFASDRTFCHFLRHYLVEAKTLSRLKLTIDELR